MDDRSGEEWRGMELEFDANVDAILNRSSSEEEELFDVVKLLLSLGNGGFGHQPVNDLGGKVDEDEAMTSDSLADPELDEINLLLELKNKRTRDFSGKNLKICERGYLDSNKFKMIDELSSEAKNQFEENKVIEMAVQGGHKRFPSAFPVADEVLQVSCADEDTTAKHKVLGKARRYRSSFD